MVDKQQYPFNLYLTNYEKDVSHFKREFLLYFRLINKDFIHSESKKGLKGALCIGHDTRYF